MALADLLGGTLPAGCLAARLLSEEAAATWHGRRVAFIDLRAPTGVAASPDHHHSRCGGNQ